MASIDDGFAQVLDDFKKRLKPAEATSFEFTTLKDLHDAINTVQERQRKNKTAQNLTRIQPFLRAMMQYKEIIEVFLNASAILSFVWGPMKFMLLIASNWSISFDTLLDTYKQLAENFPMLLDYRSMFTDNEYMKQVLVWIYEDILKFHLQALRVFTRPEVWKQFFDATWKDFQQSSKPILNDILRHRELIERKASLEQIQESRDARLQSQVSFAALKREQDLAKILAVVNWLSAADSSLDHDEFTTVRQDAPDSGRWILDEPKIREWFNLSESSIPVFWLNGIPGAGKTILTSIVIDECLKISQAKTDLSIAFFYCRDRDSQRSNFPSVAKSMVAQLLRQNPDILAYLYDECLKSAKVTLESAKDCARILDTVLRAIPKAFIIVDGIDECEPKERKALLNFLVSAIHKDDLEPGKLRGFFASQVSSDIKTALHGPEVLQLTEEHSRLDIKNYAVRWSLKIQDRFKLQPKEAREHIVKMVCEGAEGMFLFAKLVLENLYNQQNLEGVYTELKPDTFPDGFEQAYGRIVARIMENPNVAQQNIARKLLGWITIAMRPLKWSEIQGAISIDTIHGLVNFEGRQLSDHIRDICGSLVEVHAGNRIHFVHATARPYLIENKYIDECKENTLLAHLCLKYLTFDCFETSNSDEDMQNFLIRGNYGFLDYASLHWDDHLEAAIPCLKDHDLSYSSDFGIAINDFFEMYHPGQVTEDKAFDEYAQRWKEIETADSYRSLVLLLRQNAVNRQTSDELEALGRLGIVIARVRAMLVEQHSDNSTSYKLTDIYGGKWYKCPKHACYYFHEGFLQEAGLIQHTNRHSKPFCCTIIGCTRVYIGWSSEKELKMHMNKYHPDPDAYAWKFPHVKKIPPIFQCPLCPKQFTRSNTLSTHHMREHQQERPFACLECGKGFVRKYERDRHYSHVHTTGTGSNSTRFRG